MTPESPLSPAEALDVTAGRPHDQAAEDQARRESAHALAQMYVVIQGIEDPRWSGAAMHEKMRNAREREARFVFWLGRYVQALERRAASWPCDLGGRFRVTARAPTDERSLEIYAEISLELSLPHAADAPADALGLQVGYLHWGSSSWVERKLRHDPEKSDCYDDQLTALLRATTSTPGPDWFMGALRKHHFARQEDPDRATVEYDSPEPEAGRRRTPKQQSRWLKEIRGPRPNDEPPRLTAPNSGHIYADFTVLNEIKRQAWAQTPEEAAEALAADPDATMLYAWTDEHGCRWSRDMNDIPEGLGGPRKADAVGPKSDGPESNGPESDGTHDEPGHDEQAANNQDWTQTELCPTDLQPEVPGSARSAPRRWWSRGSA